jgi:hypothetical protein
MRRFVEGVDRSQTTLFPESLDDWIGKDNPVRVIDAFIDAPDLRDLGFDGVVPEVTGRPLSPGGPAQALHLWLSQPPSPAARSSERPVAMSS